MCTKIYFEKLDFFSCKIFVSFRIQAFSGAQNNTNFTNSFLTGTFRCVFPITRACYKAQMLIIFFNIQIFFAPKLPAEFQPSRPQAINSYLF